MNNYSYVAFICLIISCIFFIIAFLNNELMVGVAFIIPFIMGSGLYGFLAVIFLIISFFIFTYRSFLNDISSHAYIKNNKVDFSDMKTENRSDSKMKAGGLIMIGPIPIVFGSSKKITMGLLMVATVLIIIFYFLFK